ncbi:hypothetical protein CTAYLR_004447 [Chrysophaeum taylorii]|uniref:PDZ GRASP-type domain-containing protein n=1 Tax=Chrysophaeum taylorii TaxID=2483200 RepID=A0AAD7UDW4_9STRA|nr:hypothetical protein CTAYLR_004447 [Chrysophaeum taylorii]
MGNGVSAEEAEAVGYRVLGVQPASPASGAGLVSFLDFVVECDGTELKELDSTLIDKIKAFEDKPLACKIYNIKSRQTREVIITPRRGWGGHGLLGVTIRFDTYFKADEQLVRVLEIEDGSPAQIAGLRPQSDYLLGTAERAFADASALNEECARHLNRPVEFYAYNVDTDEVRVITVLPTHDWGGKGLLGAAVAHGYLHRLPARCRNTNGISVEPERPVHPNARNAMSDLDTPAPAAPADGAPPLPHST